MRQRTDEHLSQIDTNWTQLGLVDDSEVDSQSADEARRLLLHRYAASVYQYLLACVHDEGVADDLAQEFALRFLSGRYRGADPDKGRFRDFLKRCLSNLATDHFRNTNSEKMKLKTVPVSSHSMPEDGEFEQIWHADLLTQTWKTFESQHPADTPFYIVLSHRAEFPDQTAAEMAEQLESALPDHRPISINWIRQTLHRARKAFAIALRVEVTRTITSAGPDAINEELAALGLLKYCDS